jgi:hypothetical protein
VTAGEIESESSNPTSGSTYTLTNGKSGDLLDAENASTTNSGVNQDWTLGAVS